MSKPRNELCTQSRSHTRRFGIPAVAVLLVLVGIPASTWAQAPLSGQPATTVVAPAAPTVTPGGIVVAPGGPVSTNPTSPTGVLVPRPGGQYRGPGDIVPPGAPTPPGPDPSCNQWQQAADCSGRCTEVNWTRWNQESCVKCGNGTADEPCFRARGYNLSFGELRRICSGQICQSGGSTLTFCLPETKVCEVHWLVSSWLQPMFLPGSLNSPLGSPLPVQACITGHGGLLQTPHAFGQFSDGGYSCETVEACFSVNRECLCSAVHAWEEALYYIGYQPGTWDSKWMFHLAFTRCDECDCP